MVLGIFQFPAPRRPPADHAPPTPVPVAARLIDLSMKSLIIGARGSPLSLAQTETVAMSLRDLYPEFEINIKAIKTSGDDLSQKPNNSASGLKGLFVREIEKALVDGEIDLAVHSAKDLPGELPPELRLAPSPPRASPYDVIVFQTEGDRELFPIGSIVGTSSLRRKALLLKWRSDLKIVPIRGNLGTRLEKLKNNHCRALVLAEAGLDRLGLPKPKNITVLSPDVMLPAPSQGLLALEYRKDRSDLGVLLAPLGHKLSAISLSAERSFMKEIGAGCQTPVGALSSFSGQNFLMRAAVAEPDGSKVLYETARLDNPDEKKAEEMGRKLALKLLDKGGAEIVKRVEREKNNEW